MSLVDIHKPIRQFRYWGRRVVSHSDKNNSKVNPLA
jgi:hypothetical protein